MGLVEHGGRHANLVIRTESAQGGPIHVGFAASSRHEVDAFHRAGGSPVSYRIELIERIGSMRWSTCPTERPAYHLRHEGVTHA